MSRRRTFNGLWLWGTPLVALLITVLAASIAISIEDDNARVDSDAVITEAMVVHVDERSTRGGGWRYTPRVEFESSDGATRRETLRASRSEHEYVVGRAVMVRYSESDPSLVYDAAHRPTSLSTWVFAWVVGLIGVVLLGVAIFLTFIRPRTVKGSPR